MAREKPNQPLIRRTDEIRAKIQASQLINRLDGHAMGKLELTATQVRAAEILLKKSVPDLMSVEHSGPDGADIPMSMTITHVKPEHTGS